MLAPLGAGGMAEVYRARDSRLGREIALKVVNEVLSGDPELVRRFAQEARLAGSLNHPNLVSVHDVGLYEGSPYLIPEPPKDGTWRVQATFREPGPYVLRAVASDGSLFTYANVTVNVTK